MEIEDEAGVGSMVGGKMREGELCGEMKGAQDATENETSGDAEARSEDLARGVGMDMADEGGSRLLVGEGV